MYLLCQSKKLGIINASAVAMGLLTTAGPPAWHPASTETKELARKAASLAKERGTTIEDIALQFSLSPPYECIATTLVAMPTREILKQNLAAAIKPLKPTDMNTYNDFRAVFGNRNHHWIGSEVEQMRRELQNN